MIFDIRRRNKIFEVKEKPGEILLALGSNHSSSILRCTVITDTWTALNISFKMTIIDRKDSGGAVISCRDIDSFTMTLLGKQVDTKRGTSTESHRGHWSCLLMSPSGLWPHFLYKNLTIHHVVIPESLQFCLDNPACMPYCTGITVAGRSYHPLIVIVTGLGLSSLLLLLLSLLYFTIFLYVVFVVIVVSVFKSYFIAFPFDMTSQSKWPQICLVFVFILSIRVRIQKMRLHNYSYKCGFPLQLLPTLATCDLLSHHNTHVI